MQEKIIRNEIKRGFTLIELLAVILILAVIALIAVPIVTGIIDQARESSLKSSAYGIVKAADIYYSTKMVDKDQAIEFTCENNKCAIGDENLAFKGMLMLAR